MPSTRDWKTLLDWATLVSKDIDLGEEERDYKVQVAARLDNARDAVLANSQSWHEEFRRALTSSNLLNQYLMIELVDNLRKYPDAMRDAILVVWTPEPEPELLDAFAGAMAATPGRRLGMGNRLALGAVLLMARDPGRFPPFRARAVKKWLELVGRVAPKSSAAPSIRYGALLSFLDELLARAAEFDLPIHDRLDAQGLAWTLTQVPPPEDWPAEQTAAFLQWRGDALEEPVPVDAGRRAWLVRPGSGSGSLVGDWRSHGFVSLAASHLGDVIPGSDLPTVRFAVDKGYQHLDYSQRLAVGA